MGVVVGVGSGLVFGVGSELISGLDGGLFFGLLTGLRGDATIPTEWTVWSWRRLRQRFLAEIISTGRYKLVGRLVVGLVAGLGAWLIAWVVGGLAGGLFGGLQSGWSDERLEDWRLSRPNHGIWLSATDALRFGLVLGPG